MLLICFEVRLNKPNSLGAASTEGKLEPFNEASVHLTCWVKEKIPTIHLYSLLQRKKTGHSHSFYFMILYFCCSEVNEYFEVTWSSLFN